MKTTYDVYNIQYDYDDIKIASTITHWINDTKELVLDFEELADLTKVIHREWFEDKNKSEMETAYIQEYVVRYMNENFKSSDIVTIICYGQEKQMERQHAIDEYRSAMMCCEGSERDRYTNIYLDLINGKNICKDEED